MTTAVTINTAAKLTLLQIIQTVCQEIAIPVPTYIVGNTDAQVVQLLAIANREGREFSGLANKNGGWEELRKQQTITTAGVGSLTGNTTISSAVVSGITSTTGVLAGYVATGTGIPSETLVLSVDSSTQVTLDTACTATATGISLSFGQQSYSLPTDFGYYMNQTIWDRTYRWQLLGPLEAQEWQVLKSGLSPTGPRSRFRIMGNLLYIDPVPSSVRTIVIEYYSTGWCQSSGALAQTLWAADTDYYSLDDDSLVLGIMWRYLAAKRFSFDVEKRAYDLRVQRVMSRNGSARSLPLNGSTGEVNFLGNQNIPDTGFGS